MISLSGFDDWLNRRVEEQAAAANQTVETYIAQAVAARLITDVSLRGDDGREELLAHLAQAEVPMPESMHTLGAVVGDPKRLAALHATGLLDSPPDQVYDRITMYDGLHRFLPTLVRMEGFTVAEVKVRHRSRRAGRSKYGVWNRLFKGLRDLRTVRWMKRNRLTYRATRIRR